MKIRINQRYNAILSFAFNFLVIDLIWQALEKILYGEIRPSKEDAVMATLFCGYIVYKGMQDEQRDKQEEQTIEEDTQHD